MKTPELPKNEWLRQRSVSDLDIANNRSEEAFDAVVRLAARRTHAPFAAFTVIDADMQIFKSVSGLNLRAASRAASFCGHAILSPQMLVVPDTLADERFRDNPMVSGKPNIRFYAGVPVRSPAGFNVGTLCVVDRSPRSLDAEMRQDLRDLARVIESELLVRALAVRDHLTGLYNHETFHHFAERAWRQARRAGLSTSMIVVSLDSFEQPQYDTVDADALLRRISQCIQLTCNGTEYILARDRPNRFSLLVMNEEGNTIRVLAESIRQNLENASLPHVGLGKSRLGVSVGASNSASLPKVDRSIIDLAERAHAAVQLAKDSGNRSAFLV